MSATEITPLQITRDGLTDAATAVDQTNGNQFQNTGREIVYFNNVDGVATATATLVTQETVDGEDVADKAIVAAIGAGEFIGPFPPAIYSDANGKVQLTFTGDAAAVITVIRI